MPHELPPDAPDFSKHRQPVDFENLPEFIAQRKMLRTVRLIVLAVVTGIIVIVLFMVFHTGQRTRESLRSVTDQPADQAPAPAPEADAK